MSSRLVVNSVRHTGASADGITLDSSGNVTFPANATCSGTATGFGKFTSYAVICDQKSSDTAGGTFTSGAWQTRDLNTEILDTDGIVSISSNQFTLAAGTYLVNASAPGHRVNFHKTRLQNITDSTTLVLGTSEWSHNSYATTTRSFLSARFTISESKVFEIQHRCMTTYATIGFGRVYGYGDEKFTVVEIYKE